jgi:D-amino-acid dehydrogenase
MKVAVIGAGIVGISSAYALVKEGYNVTVFDCESYPGMKTSYANGGQISVSNSEVWNSWSNVLKAIKWLGKKDAPLLLRPTLNTDFDKVMWLFKFLEVIVRGQADQNTIKTIKMGLEARTIYNEIISEEKIEFDQSKCGILHFYRDEKYFEHAKKMHDIYASNGCEWDILNRKDIAILEPQLKSYDIVGGINTPRDWTGDIHKYCYELYKILNSKYGVSFKFNTKIENPRSLFPEFDKIVICNGVDATRMTNLIGDKQLIYPVKGYSITIEVDNTYHLPFRSLLDDQAKIVTSTLGNRFRVAGTAELAGHNYDIRRDRIEPLLNWVSINFPKLNARKYSSWACLRPMTPNMLPIVKESKVENIYYHFGHGHLGWTLSPATAKQLVKIIGK